MQREQVVVGLLLMSVALLAWLGKRYAKSLVYVKIRGDSDHDR
jgi:hypothetical protein